MTETILTLIVTILSVSQGVATLDEGQVAGLRPGDVGRIYYQLTVGAETKRIDVGAGTVLEVEDSRSLLEIRDGITVRPSYLVEFELSRPPDDSRPGVETSEAEPARALVEEVVAGDQELPDEAAVERENLEKALATAQEELVGLTRQLELSEIAQQSLRDELAAARSELSRLQLPEPSSEALEPELETGVVAELESETFPEDETPIEIDILPETVSPEPPPASDSVRDQNAEAMTLVQDWMRAWSDQRADDYLAFYAHAFQPPEGQSRSEWENHRRARILGPSFIEVTVEDPEILALEAGLATVQFRQLYRSDTFKVAANKILELVEEDGRWKILAETLQ